MNGDVLIDEVIQVSKEISIRVFITKEILLKEEDDLIVIGEAE